jgi:hypothetical protein
VQVGQRLSHGSFRQAAESGEIPWIAMESRSLWADRAR